jgi:phosphatidylglycerophosphate synthase
VRLDKAVVLAGRRGQGPSGAKDVSRRILLGLPVLERALLTAFQAGVREFILIGEDAEAGKAILSSLGDDKRFKVKGMRLEYVPLSGLADVVRREGLRGRFWLMDGDLVFAPAVLEKAAQADPGEDRNLLVVHGLETGEPGQRPMIKTADDGRTVEAFGEDAGGRAASFAGVGLCSGETLARLAGAFTKRGSVRLDAGVLAETFDPARTVAFDAGPDFCETVTSKASAKRAERYLIGTARKPTDGFFSRNFNRYVSTFLTQKLLKINVSPMEISAVVVFVGLLSGWFEGRGGYRNAVLGAFLFELASIIDGCDGENARLTFRSSKLGGTLDVAGDALIFVFFFMNLPIGLYRSTWNNLWLILGGLCLLSMILFYVQFSIYTQRSGIGNHIVAVVKDIEKSAGRPGFTGKIDWIASKIAPVYRRDFFATWVFLFILFGGAKLFMGILTVLTPVEAVYMFFYSRRRLRQEKTAEVEV